ncbi:MAG: FAD-dependent oxidoreductase [Firmicutes bacterium]|nr:FAD-dependent oxidoreductase [Bacillota bacterium]
MDSLWRSTCPLPAFPALRGTMEADVVVVGGGLCGLLTAYFCMKAGLDTVTLEGERILCGVTQGTTAKITSQHGLLYDRLIQKRGVEKARQYAQAQQRAVGRYADLVTSLAIDCDFSKLPAYLYSVQASPALERECRAAERLGLPASLTGADRLPFPASQALCFADQAQFHPLRFAAAIATRLNIRERSRVLRITNNSVYTDAGEVRARHIVICTHYPIRNVPGFYFARMHQSRGYVLALENAADVDGMWLDARDGGYSLRNVGRLLLLGGHGHRTGDHPYASSFRLLRGAAKEFYPDAREVARWSAQDCMTADAVPFIGRFARFLPNVYVATGFNKWGMTNSMAAAELIADRIAGKKEYPFADVFSPGRRTGMEVKYSIKKTPKCTHMGCSLEWNPDTRTWDCPCHGSRFTRGGRVIDTPAIRDGRWGEHDHPL